MKHARLSVLAALIAACGQALLNRHLLRDWRPFVWLTLDARLRCGWILLVLGGLLFVLAWRTSRDGDPDPIVAETPGPVDEPQHATLRGVLVVSAVLAYAANIGDWFMHGESLRTRWLWGSAIALLLLSQLRPRSIRWRPQRRPGDPPWSTATGLAVLTMALGFCLRFVHLTTLPLDVHGDPAGRGLIARDLTAGGWAQLLAVRGTALPVLGYAPTALGLRLFGDNLFGLRMSGVVDGMIVLLGTYLLAKYLFNRRVAVLAMAISAIGCADIHFSRLPGYMSPVPWLVFGIYFLLRGLRAQSGFSCVLSGVIIGVGMQMYFSGRIVVFIIAAFLAYLLIRSPRWLLDRWSGLVLFGLSVLITLGPLLAFFAARPELLVVRSNEVYLFSSDVMAHLQGKYHVDSVSQVVREQIWRSLLMFNLTTDTSDQFAFHHPLLNPCLGPMFVLGIAYATGRLHRPRYALPLIWLSLVVIVGAILTIDAPFWPRLLVLLPAMAILTAVGLDRLAVALSAALGDRPWARWLSMSAVAVLLGWTGYQNWNWYTSETPASVNPRAWMARLIIQRPGHLKFCMVRGPYSFAEREFGFLAPGYELLDFPREQLAQFLPQCLREGRVWLFYMPDHADLLAQFQQRWPGARQEQFNYPTGAPGPIFWYAPPGA